MLKFGLFEDFNGSDTLLIWNDGPGLSHLAKFFVRLSDGTERRAALHRVEWASGHHGLTVDFQRSDGQPDALEAKRNTKGVTILAQFSAERFAEFAEKVAVLADAANKAGHHYLDWQGMGDIQVIVSKGEYPPDFGTSR